MIIHLATDHAGFLHKEAVKAYLLEKEYTVVDHGARELVESDDYPDFITPCATAVAADSTSVGIIFGGSGQGEAMVANRVKGVRATVYYGGSIEIISLSREHNNANVLSIGARFVTVAETKKILDLWLSTAFSEDPKHIRRINKF